jgi:copper chaperone CopZ
MEIGDLQGVKQVEANAESKTAKITFGDPATEEKIKATLAEINYPAVD